MERRAFTEDVTRPTLNVFRLNSVIGSDGRWTDVIDSNWRPNTDGRSSDVRIRKRDMLSELGGGWRSV
jgi:hypothetical protein